MGQQKPVAPQVIPPRGDAPKPPREPPQLGLGEWRCCWSSRRWWPSAILGTAAVDPRLGAERVRGGQGPHDDPELRRRGPEGRPGHAAHHHLRHHRDDYVNYNDRAWTETHSRVAAAKQYPVVASIDQVVVNGDHAEANVTTFMAYAPQTRSTRSFDLQFRDDQWKICQAPDS